MATSNRSELQAKLIAAFVTLECLLLFVVISKPREQPPRKISSVPVATPQPLVEEPTHPIDPNERFRSVPGRWVSVDFKHHSYGPYRFYGGRKINLTLKNGEYEYEVGPSNEGWFSLRDVYYVDVTGDQIPDAIVDLGHIECGASCDGGTDLFFIYSINAEGELRKLFQYETGSYGYGCGLKSLTLSGREVRLELFGRCPRPAMDSPGPGKFMVQDQTQLTFRYVENSFRAIETRFVTSDVMDVRLYKPEVYISER